MGNEKVKAFIDSISDDKFSEAKDAVGQVFKEKYDARIAGAREKVGLVKPEEKVPDPIKTEE